MNQERTYDLKWLSKIERRQYPINLLVYINEGFKYWKHRNLIAKYSSNPEEFRNQVKMVDDSIPMQNISWLKKVNEDDLSNIAIDYNEGFNRNARILSGMLMTRSMEDTSRIMEESYSYIMESEDIALMIYRMVDYIFFSEWMHDLILWNAGACKPLLYYSLHGFIPVKAEPYMIRAEMNTILSVFNNKLKGEKICHIYDLEIPQAMKEAGFTGAVKR